MKNQIWLIVGAVLIALCAAGLQANEQEPGAWEKSKKYSSETWVATKKTSKNAWKATKQKSGEVWDATKQKSGEVWDATRKMSAEAWHKAKGAVENTNETDAQKPVESASAREI